MMNGSGHDQRTRRLSRAALSSAALAFVLSGGLVFTAVLLEEVRRSYAVVVLLGSAVAATLGIVLGYMAKPKFSWPFGEDARAECAAGGVILGYGWWVLACGLGPPKGQLDAALGLIAVVVALIELPRIVIQKSGEGRRGTVAAGVSLAAMTWLLLAVMPPLGLIGAIELALLAGWLPFRRPEKLTDRQRFLISVLFYGLALLTVIWGWWCWRHWM